MIEIIVTHIAVSYEDFLPAYIWCSKNIGELQYDDNGAGSKNLNKNNLYRVGWEFGDLIFTFRDLETAAAFKLV